MLKLICPSSFAMLLLLGCPGNEGGDTNSLSIPYELNQPIDARETKAIAMGHEFACFLDSAGHAHCWSHPKRFVQGPDPSHRGAFVMDYPKKSNADLAAHKFVNLAASGGVCAIRDDNKVLCFMPENIASIATDSLSGLGRFTKVATTGYNQICAIDQRGVLSFYDLDLGKNVANNQYFVAEGIKEFAVGASSKGPFGCWITTNSLLQCELFDESSAVATGSDDTYRIANGSGHNFSIAKISTDKKTIWHFGNAQKSAIDEFEAGDRERALREIVITQRGIICGLFEGSNILRCNGLNSPYVPKKKSVDLEKEVFVTISVSEKVGCGLRPDKTASCWRPNNFLTGVPSHLRAE